MRTRYIPLGEQGEIVFIRRTEISNQTLTVMVLYKCLLYISNEGEIELIDPRSKKYGVKDLSQPGKLHLVTLDAWEQHVERRNFESKLFALAESTEGALQRAVVGFIHIRGNYKRINEPQYPEGIESQLKSTEQKFQRPAHAHSTEKALIHAREKESNTSELVN